MNKNPEPQKRRTEDEDLEPQRHKDHKDNTIIK
jgi:hypothetical protein